MQYTIKAEVDKKIKKERNRAIVAAYLKQDRTMSAIAKEFKVCRERVRQIIDRWEEDPTIYD